MRIFFESFSYVPTPLACLVHWYGTR